MVELESHKEKVVSKAKKKGFRRTLPCHTHLVLGCVAFPVRKWVSAVLVSLVLLVVKAKLMLTASTVAFGSQRLAHWLEATELARGRDEPDTHGACAFPGMVTGSQQVCVWGWM